MIVTLIALTRRHPLGGALSVYEFANGLRRRGHDINIVHFSLAKDGVTGVEDLPWARFEPAINHTFTSSEDCDYPDADFIFQWEENAPRRYGLPVSLIQGYRIFSAKIERHAFGIPCPKVCIAKWLIRTGIELGAPAHQLVHIPYGIDHDKYRIKRPIDDRPMQVCWGYRNHASKGPVAGLEALIEVKRRVPEANIVAFSPVGAAHDIPSWMRFVADPPQAVLVDELYNGSSVYLCSSVDEGFGFQPVEAMACGAALVSTSNGGSEDYAMHGETALVCEPKDVDAMADHVEQLLRDDAYRLELARRGNEYVRSQFDWDISAAKLESFLQAYGADPESYLGT